MKLTLLCVLITTMFALNKLSRKTRGTPCKYIKTLQEQNSQNFVKSAVAFPIQITDNKAIPPTIYLNNKEISLTKLYQESEFQVTIKNLKNKITWNFKEVGKPVQSFWLSVRYIHILITLRMKIEYIKRRLDHIINDTTSDYSKGLPFDVGFDGFAEGINYLVKNNCGAKKDMEKIRDTIEKIKKYIMKLKPQKKNTYQRLKDRLNEFDDQIVETEEWKNSFMGQLGNAEIDWNQIKILAKFTIKQILLSFLF
jgi:hypothetical protein